MLMSAEAFVSVGIDGESCSIRSLRDPDPPVFRPHVAI